MVKLRKPAVVRLLAALGRDRKGATAVEYGLVLALIVLALMAALVGLGGTNQNSWTNILARVTAATGH